jgi:hypothetical protein
MLFSAVKRDWMYVDIYGLTRVRIIGEVFVFWLFVMLVVLAVLTLFKNLKEKWLFIGTHAASIVVVLLLNVWNVDAMVVAHTPKHHDYKDYFYIANLSADGVEGWKEAIPKLREQFEQLKLEKRTSPEFTGENKSQLAGIKLALASLKYRSELLDKKYNPDLDAVVSEYYDEYFEESYRNNHKDLKKVMYSIEAQRLHNLRHWQLWNASEAAAYRVISTQRTLFFAEVDQLMTEVNAFQQQYQLPVYDQERRLLYDFSYPFINVTTGRYAPQTLEDINREFSDKTSPSPYVQSVE